MTNLTTTSPMALVPSLEAAWQDVDSSFERFCLTAGIEAMEQMLCEDAQRLAGPRHSRAESALASAGARRRGRSASTAARLMCAGRACAAMAMRFSCRLGGRLRPRIGLAAGR